MSAEAGCASKVVFWLVFFFFWWWGVEEVVESNYGLFDGQFCRWRQQPEEDLALTRIDPTFQPTRFFNPSSSGLVFSRDTSVDISKVVVHSARFKNKRLFKRGRVLENCILWSRCTAIRGGGECVSLFIVGVLQIHKQNPYSSYFWIVCCNWFNIGPWTRYQRDWTSCLGWRLWHAMQTGHGWVTRQGQEPLLENVARSGGWRLLIRVQKQEHVFSSSSHNPQPSQTFLFCFHSHTLDMCHISFATGPLRDWGVKSVVTSLWRWKKGQWAFPSHILHVLHWWWTLGLFFISSSSLLFPPSRRFHQHLPPHRAMPLASFVWNKRTGSGAFLRLGRPTTRHAAVPTLYRSELT